MKKDNSEIHSQYLFFKGAVGRNKVLTRKEEGILSAEIHKARARVWFDIFGHSLYVEGIVKFLQKRIKEDQFLQRGSKRAILKSGALNFRPLLAATRKLTTSQKDLFKWAHRRTEIAITLAAFDTNNVIAVEIQDLLKSHHVFDKRITSYSLEYVKKIEKALGRLIFLKNKFMRHNVFLVLAIAKKFKFDHIPFSDLVQEGMLGLMTGVERFDGTRGFKFSTYGTWWIRHHISRAVDNKERTVRIPCGSIKNYQRMKKVRAEMEVNGEEVSTVSLAKKMGMSLAKMEGLLALPMRVSSLDKALRPGEDSDLTLLNAIENDDPSPVDLMEEQETEASAYALLNSLGDDKLERVIRGRFGLNENEEELKLREIGEEYGLSRERIRQLQFKALGLMKMRATKIPCVSDYRNAS